MTKPKDSISDRLNILFIITGLRFGGAERLLLLTCKYLRAQYECTIKVVYFDPYAPMKKLFDEENIHTELVSRNLLTIPRLALNIFKQRYHVIHTHLIHADLYGRAAAILALPLHKHVIFTTVHDVHWFRWQKSIYYLLVRWIDLLLILPKACHVIAISNSVKELLLKSQHYQAAKISVLYNAIEINDTKKLKHYDGSFVKCLYLGRLVKEKNLFCLIDAMNLIRDDNVTLSIVGEGEEEADLRHKVQELKMMDKITFYGATKEPERYYQDHDIFILPSSHEGLGIVILEAFGHQLPVIGSNVHGIQELLSEQRGILFEDNNPNELADHIKTLSQNAELRSMYGQRGYDYVKQNHDIRQYVRQLNTLYYKALTSY